MRVVFADHVSKSSPGKPIPQQSDDELRALLTNTRKRIYTFDHYDAALELKGRGRLDILEEVIAANGDRLGVSATRYAMRQK